MHKFLVKFSDDTVWWTDQLAELAIRATGKLLARKIGQRWAFTTGDALVAADFCATELELIPCWPAVDLRRQRIVAGATRAEYAVAALDEDTAEWEAA